MRSIHPSLTQWFASLRNSIHYNFIPRTISKEKKGIFSMEYGMFSYRSSDYAMDCFPWYPSPFLLFYIRPSCWKLLQRTSWNLWHPKWAQLATIFDFRDLACHDRAPKPWFLRKSTATRVMCGLASSSGYSIILPKRLLNGTTNGRKMIIAALAGPVNL